MAGKNSFIVFLAVIIILAAPSAYAQVCDDITFTIDISDPVCGSNISVSLDNAASGIPDYWGSFLNATLSIPSNISNVSRPLFVNLSAESGPVQWLLSCTAPGNYTLSVSADNGTEACIKNLTLSPRSATSPNISISAPSAVTFIALNANSLNATLSNTGNGTAKNITTIFAMPNATITPAYSNIAQILNGTNSTQAFLITPQLCANFLGLLTSDYYNEVNEQQPQSSFTPNITVTGPYLSVSNMSFSNPAPQEQSIITISATVNNSVKDGCDYNITNSFTVSFYNGNPDSGGVLIGSATLPPLSSDSTATSSVSWTVPSPGTFAIYAVVSLSEPSFNSSYSTSSTLTASAVPRTIISSASNGFSYSPSACGNGICNTEYEGCGKAYYCEADCGKCPEAPPAVEECNESWECSEYTDCINGTQTRSCTDMNSCGTETEKPSISKECTPQPPADFEAANEALAAITSAESVVSDAAKSLLSQAKSEFQIGNYNKAIDLARQALDADKTTPATPTGFAALATSGSGAAAAVIIIAATGFLYYKKMWIFREKDAKAVPKKQAK